MPRYVAPFAWYGGKYSHLNRLLPLVNGTPHVTYVEPFAGSAAVLLNKETSRIEVYNDLFGDVVNFFRVLRDDGDQLRGLLELTPYSREEFRRACEERSEDPVEQARRFFVRARQARSGLGTVATPGNWAYSRVKVSREMAEPVSKWLSSVDGISWLTTRLSRVQIESKDAVDIVGRYDSPDALFYVDPPYVMSTRTGGKAYDKDTSDDLHDRLLTSLLSAKGKVILSGYASPSYDSRLGHWHRAEWTKPAPATGNGSNRTEVVWANFPLPS